MVFAKCNRVEVRPLENVQCVNLIMCRSRTVLAFSALLIGMVAFAQSSVGALGKSSEAAQQVFDRGLQQPSDTIWDVGAVQVQPQYPGGDTAMYNYLVESIVYPEGEGNIRLAGKVYLEFIVRKDGRVDQVNVRRGASPALDAEAVRVVRAMPRWTPAFMNGKPVDTRYMLPIMFMAE